MKDNKGQRRARCAEWRCQGAVVFRDVPPGRVPITFVGKEDGSRIVLDIEARIVDAIERIARKEQKSFVQLVAEVV